MIRKTRSSEKTAERRRASTWVTAALAAVALLTAVFYERNPLSQGAAGYAQTISVTAAGTYVTLRTLNAVLSTAEEIEVGGSVVVFGSVQPLKGLEPIDDTIERVAGMVFALMIVTGVISVAMGPTSALGAVLVAMASLLALADRSGRMGALPRRLGVYGALLALALPLTFLSADAVADRLTASVWSKHTAIIDEITDSVAPIDTVPSEAEDFGIRKIWEDIEQYRKLTGQIYLRANDLIESFVAILSVFVFKIFVLPALLIGAVVLVARRAAG